MIADESNIIYNNQTTGLPDWSNKSFRKYLRQKYSSVQKIQKIEYIFLNTSDKTNGSQNNLKNQTIHTTFLKSDDGKSCLIPDIFLYSLAESLILEDISGFWLTFMYLFCVRGTNYKPNVFRTEMYKTISANKSCTFWKLRYQFRNQISSFTTRIFKMALHVKINIENVRTFKTKKSEII